MLFDKDNRFNLANLITFGNIAAGLIAIHFIVHGDFFTAIILAWIAGALDIADGKVARKYNLSTEFGIQVDSYADFISFVVMPSFLLYYAITAGASNVTQFILGLVFIAYIIAGLRRLIEFNMKSEEGVVTKFFEGVPTPLGAILLWLLYLLFSYDIIVNTYVIAVFVAGIAWALNSKLKIPHP
ncbi:MAG: CDP-diacylglycerol--serine O-phosphatidyltransferase (EC [uncultured Sulfurovum sp.]|uniref:CDP-diacylglycerol--serine O-phosphatidyltransferase (EC) n=1 Tax=uncultured Sulfurovum sp. TaxID=269237 RepID=A0A6S6SBQ7_9BACT|nr:MAG: CDP-diacylglycerol--serine O-phosphatidyltransferase (EC [uncultured Sulfurovum sp.]